MSKTLARRIGARTALPRSEAQPQGDTALPNDRDHNGARTVTAMSTFIGNLIGFPVIIWLVRVVAPPVH